MLFVSDHNWLSNGFELCAKGFWLNVASVLAYADQKRNRIVSLYIMVLGNIDIYLIINWAFYFTMENLG